MVGTWPCYIQTTRFTLATFYTCFNSICYLRNEYLNETIKKMHNSGTSSYFMRIHKRIIKIKTVGPSKFGECLLARMSQSSKPNSLRNDFMTWLQGNSVKVKHLNLQISLRKVTHQVSQFKYLLTSFRTISRVYNFENFEISENVHYYNLKT